MATAAVLNAYHQQPFFNSKLTSFYWPSYMPNHYSQPKPQKPKKKQQQPELRTPTPTKTVERVDSNLQPLRPRREPRIHRQVILLPTPDPIVRQVRRRLPTPEREIIQRTVIRKPNGDVVVQQERHRKKSKRSQSQSKPTTQQ